MTARLRARPRLSTYAVIVPWTTATAAVHRVASELSRQACVRALTVSPYL
jgi:hypothetical protein